MCVMIEWGDGAMWLDRQIHLSCRVPELILKDQYPEKARKAEGCLCPVDVPKTLDNAGVEWKRGDGIPGFIVTDPSPSDEPTNPT